MTVPAVVVLAVTIVAVLVGAYSILVLPFRVRRERYAAEASAFRSDLILDLATGRLRPSKSAVRLLNASEKASEEALWATVPEVCALRFMSRHLRQLDDHREGRPLIDTADPDFEELRRREEQLLTMSVKYISTSSIGSLLSPLWIGPVVAVYRKVRGIAPQESAEQSILEFTVEDEQDSLAPLIERAADHALAPERLRLVPQLA